MFKRVFTSAINKKFFSTSRSTIAENSNLKWKVLAVTSATLSAYLLTQNNTVYSDNRPKPWEKDFEKKAVSSHTSQTPPPKTDAFSSVGSGAVATNSVKTLNNSSVGKKRERTYIMIKPDGVARGLVGEIIARFEKKGYQLVGLKQMNASPELLKEHYSDLKNKPFFPRLIKYMNSGPVVCMIWEGNKAVKTGRKMLGETNPLESLPGTIRGDFCIEIGMNLCHGSDSVESAEHEIALWFPEGATEWNRSIDNLIYE